MHPDQKLPASNPVLGVMRASAQARARRRASDESREEQVRLAHLFPSADDLLRGSPPFGSDPEMDCRHFLALLRRDILTLAGPERAEELSALLDDLDGSRTVAGLRRLEAALASLCLVTGLDLREELLRCRIHRGLAGDAEATAELAMDALASAVGQSWHEEGDGSRLVWSSLGWLAQAESHRAGESLSPTGRVARMDRAADRVLSTADDLRIRVARCLSEIEFQERTQDPRQDPS